MRLIDRNVNENEAEFDRLLGWADMILAGGMLVQQRDLFAIIERAKAKGKPIVVGGPDVSSSPQLYERADFRIVGEAEGCIDQFIAAWDRGERSGMFQTPLFSVDVTTTPVPRFDLLTFEDYAEITVQFSRGCPFQCEFCDIIELYGRRPRVKTSAQMLAELQRLYELGYHGVVQFSDDNLIGNKVAVKAFLPDLIAWQQQRSYPFQFVTEASMNLADDDQLLGLLRDANFAVVFIGIESPDPNVLVAAQKKQNTRRDIVESIHRVQAGGLAVAGGFIVGFDNEPAGTAAAMIDLIEAAAIPASMVGLLYALPNTQLTRRLEAEDRLGAHHNLALSEHQTDQCMAGLNFETSRPRDEILRDYRTIVARIYDPNAYFQRIRRMVDPLTFSGKHATVHPLNRLRAVRRLVRFLFSVTVRQPAMAWHVFGLVAYILRHNPRAIRVGMYMASFYAHFGPFSQAIIAEVDRQLRLLAAAPSAMTSDAATSARFTSDAQLETL
jgi:radical SAM superfamily enzyme YgiQ (UPF0313 family)